MTSATPTEPSSKSSGWNADVIRELMKNPVYGVPLVLIIVLEGALLTFCARSESATERYVLLFFAVLVAGAVLVFLSVERRRLYELKRAQLAVTSTAPQSMVKDPIPLESARRKPDLMSAPDGTFVCAKAPPGWSVGFTSLAEKAEAEIRTQRLPSLNEDTLPFRPGPLVAFEELRSSRIEYLPGKSLLNGRPVIGALNEKFSNQVLMFSVSKAGGVIRDMSAEHVFTLLLFSLLPVGCKISEIREAPSEVGGRRTLTGRGTRRYAHIVVDGNETEEAAADVRLHIVEHENFLYVIQISSLFVEHGTETEAREAQLNAIVSSFQATSAADAAERERADVTKADEAYRRLISLHVPMMLVGKAQALGEEMRTPGGSPRVTQEHLDNARLLAAYANEFQDLIPPEVGATLTAFREAVEKAMAGEPADLAMLLDPPGEPIPGTPPLPAGGGADSS